MIMHSLEQYSMEFWIRGQSISDATCTLDGVKVNNKLRWNGSNMERAACTERDTTISISVVTRAVAIAFPFAT